MAANFAAREKKNADKKIGEVGLLVITYFHRHRKLSHDEKGKHLFFKKKKRQSMQLNHQGILYQDFIIL